LTLISYFSVSMNTKSEYFAENEMLNDNEGSEEESSAEGEN